MDIQDVLRILKNGAEKPKDDLNDYTKGKRDGQVQAYSHAWTLVKNLSISGVVGRSEQLVAFLKWIGDGYDFENNAEKIVREYIDEGN